MDSNTLEIVLKIVCTAAGAIASGVPLLIGLIRSMKQRKAAKTAEAKAIADKNMLEKVTALVQEAEATYRSIDLIMKQTQAQSAGALKKDNVLTKLENYAISQGYNYDQEAWSNKIDDIVKMTREVNAK